TVAFSTDWREDAARRDFTINALYCDPGSREISDFFGGLDDLEARRVRFIGDAATRIAEDHLRILRFFRLHARFGARAPDPEGLAAAAGGAAAPRRRRPRRCRRSPAPVERGPEAAGGDGLAPRRRCPRGGLPRRPRRCA